MRQAGTGVGGGCFGGGELRVVGEQGGRGVVGMGAGDWGDGATAVVLIRVEGVWGNRGSVGTRLG